MYLVVVSILTGTVIFGTILIFCIRPIMRPSESPVINNKDGKMNHIK